MFYPFQEVRIIFGQFKGKPGVIYNVHPKHTPTLYEVKVSGMVIALYENELEPLYNLSEKMGVE